MKPCRILFVALILSCIGFWIFAGVDTAPYRKAVQAFVDKVPASRVETMMAQTQADFALLYHCNQLRDHDGNRSFFKEEARACLLTNIPQVRTASGAKMASTEAQVWLLSHPGDQGIIDATLVAIGHGRVDLASSRDYFMLQDEIAKQHDRSILLRLRDGEQKLGSHTILMTAVEGLDKAEIGVLLPDVVRRQNEWHLELNKLLSDAK